MPFWLFGKRTRDPSPASGIAPVTASGAPPAPDRSHSGSSQALKTFWPQSNIGNILASTLSALVLGGIFLLIFAGGQNGSKSIAAVVSATFLVAAAAFVVGVFIGCLFGVPQSVALTPEQAKEAAAKSGLYRPSNQLQQVSDWLVKILLGASLTQLANVTAIGAYFEEFVGSAAAAMVIVTYFFVVGFLSGYFVMIIYLGPLIRNAGEDLLADRERILIAYRLYQALYRSPAELDQAIREAQEYVNRSQAHLNDDPELAADIYGHLACGYGQQYKRAAPEARQSLLENALKCAAKAVEYDVDWGDVLVDVYDADPDEDSDDDWAVFKARENEPELKGIKTFIDGLRPRGEAKKDTDAAKAKEDLVAANKAKYEALKAAAEAVTAATTALNQAKEALGKDANNQTLKDAVAAAEKALADAVAKKKTADERAT
jgi:uncharacterized membrane-anchored protein YhcB (DUF1043 family)